MSLEPKFEELENLYMEVKDAYEGFYSQPLPRKYYIYACSNTERQFWTKILQALRDRVNVVINKWELGLIGIRLVDEAVEEYSNEKDEK